MPFAPTDTNYFLKIWNSRLPQTQKNTQKPRPTQQSMGEWHSPLRIPIIPVKQKSDKMGKNKKYQPYVLRS
ncbi:hypothetical protein [Okeania sp. KiyG1]|uniref:hypothetical protein n=1 Tax=Okeania sp. KiyG1 TaxID=2720165 RepID=UPI001921CE62|nr:hypothetical protein [Okeania sp. KiyG1]